MTVPKLTDFKDWISPMIVKELRQGTRTRIFSFAFILLLSALIIVMLTSLMSTRPNTAGATGGFWFCVVVAFLMVMPLRGFGAISNEMKMQTLDMVLLTRLSASKIIYGKWAALFSQTLLVASALLPFVVIRYFLGGIDFVNEIIWLVLLVISSGTLTALTVGLSAQSSHLLRGAIALLILIFGFSLAGNFMFMRGGSPLSDPEFWEGFAVFVTSCVFATYFLLAMGATHFAPISENHATRKRLAALLYIAALALFYFLDFDEEMLLVVGGMVLSVVVIDALTERPAPVASVYIPFVKRGAFGRLLGKFLYPGWQSGLLFSALIVAGFTLLLSSEFSYFDDDEWAGFFSVLGLLIFPAALIQLAFSSHPNPFGLYILIALVSGAACGLVGMIDDNGDTTILWFLCLIPMACLIIAGNNYSYNGDETIMVVSFVVTSLWLLVLIFKAFPLHRQISQLEKVVKDLIDKEGATIDEVEAPGTSTPPPAE